MIKTGLTIIGALAAAFSAALCCIGPVLAVFAGIGGAGLATTVEPLRPYLLVTSALLFLVAAGVLYRRPTGMNCAESRACTPHARQRTRILFWAALGIAAILASFPWWSKLLV